MGWPSTPAMTQRVRLALPSAGRCARTGRMTTTPKIRLVCAAFLCAASTVSAAERITFGDWVLECLPSSTITKSCQLRQTLTSGAGKRIVEFAVKRAGKATFLEVVTPLSISIPYGVSLMTTANSASQLPSVDPWTAQSTTTATGSKKSKDKGGDTKTASAKDAPTPAATAAAPSGDAVIPLQLAACDPDGCRAVAPLDDKVMSLIKSAEQLAVRFQDSKTGKILTINGSPKGFTEGAAMVMAAP